MATTVENITDAAYRKCGILSPTTAEDASALVTLNNMLGVWSADLLLPYVTRESFNLVAGQAEYVIGKETGDDFDTERPLSIVNVYLQDSDGYSYSVKQLSAKEYNRIGTKTLEGRPKSVYFIPEHPSAKIIFNKEADAVYTAYFEFNKNLTEYAAEATVALPNEYREPLIYNLAIRLAEDNSVDLPRTVLAMASGGYALLAKQAILNKIAPKVKFDIGSGCPLNIETNE